ncbi:hypothetical protein [Halomonas getboli]|uniref:hypothetical protein n=1 Tax=Halomonas getboli TaxID=2935862 RepID=UPI001FFEF510|nr:hypothetical protein [Halomonas getboli]MCK2183594.1 hypothetical protein [Halomonas getboli]
MTIKKTFRWAARKSSYRGTSNRRISGRPERETPPGTAKRFPDAEADRDEAFLLDESAEYEMLDEDQIDEDDDGTHDRDTCGLNTRATPDSHPVDRPPGRTTLHLPDKARRRKPETCAAPGESQDSRHRIHPPHKTPTNEASMVLHSQEAREGSARPSLQRPAKDIHRVSHNDKSYKHATQENPSEVSQKAPDTEADSDEDEILNNSVEHGALGDTDVDKDGAENPSRLGRSARAPKRTILHLPDKTQRSATETETQPSQAPEPPPYANESSSPSSSWQAHSEEALSMSHYEAEIEPEESEPSSLLDDLFEDNDIVEPDIYEDSLEELDDRLHENKNTDTDTDTDTDTASNRQETTISPYLRACQQSLAFIRRNGWSDSYLHPLAEVLDTRGYGTILSHFQAYADRGGMTPDEFLLASQLREFWSNNHSLWVTFTSSGKMSRFTQRVISWAQCLRIISLFSQSSESSPLFEEIEAYLLDLFDVWYSSDTLRTAYGSYSAFLNASILSSDPEVEASMQLTWEDPVDDRGIFPNDVYDITNRQENEFYDTIGQPQDLDSE